MAITTILGTDSPSDSRTVINDNFADLDTTKADLASPTFTGTPTAPTQTAGDNSTAIATTAYVDSLSFSSFESTAGATHSLTTTASQSVLVTARVMMTFTAGSALAGDVNLKYNGVVKDSIPVDRADSTTRGCLVLQYEETPGAATADITIDTTGSFSPTLSSYLITVQKIG